MNKSRDRELKCDGKVLKLDRKVLKGNKEVLKGKDKNVALKGEEEVLKGDGEALTPKNAKLFNWNFHLLEVVSRWRDSQLEVSKNYSDFTK